MSDNIIPVVFHKNSEGFLCVETVALFYTITSCFRHVYHNKEEEWARKTLNGLNKILNFEDCLGESRVSPGTQVGILKLNMIHLNFDNLDFDKWIDLMERCRIRDIDGNILSTVIDTIESSFLHVYDNKDKEWAKQTLEGLKKVANYRECYIKDAIPPGKQKGRNDLTMDSLGYMYYDLFTLQIYDE